MFASVGKQIHISKLHLTSFVGYSIHTVLSTLFFMLNNPAIGIHANMCTVQLKCFDKMT